LTRAHAGEITELRSTLSRTRGDQPRAVDDMAGVGRRSVRPLAEDVADGVPGDELFGQEGG
jgi:hypothetical protein